MNYKEEIYKKYVTTHIANRKGVSSQKKLKKQASIYKSRFLKYLPVDKNSKIIDLGAGSGGLIWWLNQSGFSNCRGIDGSIEQVKEAHRLGIDNIVMGDVFETLKVEKNCELIIACDLIEHFEKQLVYDFLKQSFEALIPGGTLLLQVPNAESPYFGRIRYGDFTHETAFTESSTNQLLNTIGFNQIIIKPWRPVITGPLTLLRYLLWKMIEVIIKFPIQIESGKKNVNVTMNLIVIAKKPK